MALVTPALLKALFTQFQKDFQQGLGMAESQWQRIATLVKSSSKSNTYGWRSYLGDLYGTDDIPAYAAPARATDLTGLPPTFIIVGGADGFRDEDIIYALRLSEAGVSTELHVLPGAPHGVQMFAGTDIANRWSQLVGDWLSRMLRA